MRRWEKERKRDVERRRLQAFAEEKERVATANKFLEKIFNLKLKNTFVQLQKMQNLIDEQVTDSERKSELLE